MKKTLEEALAQARESFEREYEGGGMITVGRYRAGTTGGRKAKPLPEWTAAELRAARANDWRAMLYDLVLRREGYSLTERTARVAERYPHTARRMEALIREVQRGVAARANGAVV